MRISEILTEAQKYPTAWAVSAVGPSDEKFEVTRTVINSQGKYQIEKHGKTFASSEAAEEAAKKLNAKK